MSVHTKRPTKEVQKYLVTTLSRCVWPHQVLCAEAALAPSWLRSTMEALAEARPSRSAMFLGSAVPSIVAQPPMSFLSFNYEATGKRRVN